MYACGAWIDNTTLPPSQPIIIESFSAVEKHNNDVTVRCVIAACWMFLYFALITSSLFNKQVQILTDPVNAHKRMNKV